MLSTPPQHRQYGFRWQQVPIKHSCSGVSGPSSDHSVATWRCPMKFGTTDKIMPVIVEAEQPDMRDLQHHFMGLDLQDLLAMTYDSIPTNLFNVNQHRHKHHGLLLEIRLCSKTNSPVMIPCRGKQQVIGFIARESNSLVSFFPIMLR